MFFAALVAALVAIDRELKTKYDKLHNYGFPFGFLKEKPLVVKYIPLFITLGVLFLWLSTLVNDDNFLKKLALSLMLAGGISNTFDRLNQGYVVDYIEVKNKKTNKNIIFNLADVSVVAGALLLAADDISKER